MLKKTDTLDNAMQLKKQMEEDYRFLHAHAETGFSLLKTLVYVEQRLLAMGYEPKRCGRAGISVCVGKENEKSGRCILLRADMDALPIREKTELSCACKQGNMHACGHDLHTTMLLGAAKLLKDRENQLGGIVKLMFQPAEEILEGAKDMISEGILESPRVDCAMMLHVTCNVPWKTGTVIVSSPGISAPAADFFRITVQGKACHGSTPWEGVNAISIAAKIVSGLEAMTANEFPAGEKTVCSIGTIQGGEGANIIAAEVALEGSLRAFDENRRRHVKKRLEEISSETAKAFGGEATVLFHRGCPTLVNDAEMSEKTGEYMRNLLGPDMVLTSDELMRSGNGGSGGSEDFAYVSQEIPSIMVALAAGEAKDGYSYPLHNAKTAFDLSVLPYGCAVYAECALRFLQDMGKESK